MESEYEKLRYKIQQILNKVIHMVVTKLIHQTKTVFFSNQARHLIEVMCWYIDIKMILVAPV